MQINMQICERFQRCIMSVLRSHTDIQIKCSNIYTLQTTIYRLQRLFPRYGSIRHSIIDTRDVEDRDTQARTWRKAAQCSGWGHCTLCPDQEYPSQNFVMTFTIYADMSAMFENGDSDYSHSRKRRLQGPHLL